MQNLIETDCGYQGITLDERMALRHLFDKDDDNIVTTDQLPDPSLYKGPFQ